MKITHSKPNINRFGGLNFCINLLEQQGILHLIDHHLGPRAVNSGYSYSQILMNNLSIYLTGGDCAEDISVHLRESLQKVKGLSVCSPDTLLRGIKELATPVETFANKTTGVVHQFNINQQLNTLLVKALKHTGQLNSDVTQDYTLDYDNQVIETEKFDAKRTYKRCEGYQPGIASIGDHIVYVEGRNGNSQAKYLQAQTLERVFDNLATERVPIKRFRADGASYQKDVLDLVSQRCERFYIRARMMSSLEKQIGAIGRENWKKERLGVQQMEVTEITNFCPFGGETPYRLVVSRIRRKDRQTGLFSGQDYIYRAIITNDLDCESQQIISFYNARGKSEKIFDCMNNDFGWSKLPCSFLGHNTAFMILTALYANLYHFILSKFASKLDWLESNFRIKKFIHRFITVPAKWIRTGRQDILKLFTDRDYSPILK